MTNRNKDAWTGKGSWVRPPAITREELNNNIDRIFGKRLSWLEHKAIKEAWLK